MQLHRTTWTRSATALGSGAILTLVLLGGCSSGPATQSPDTSASADYSLGVVTTAPNGVQEVTLHTSDDYVFTPDTVTVAPGTVRVTVQNVATQMTHEFSFTEGAGPEPITASISFLGPGQTDTVEFAVTALGDYPFECTFHVALGQVGTMLVEQP